MDTLKTITLIETSLTRRGEGKAPNSPIRVITQYWTPQGELVFEKDPSAAMLSPEKRSVMRGIIFESLGENDKSRSLIAALWLS